MYNDLFIYIVNGFLYVLFALWVAIPVVRIREGRPMGTGRKRFEIGTYCFNGDGHVILRDDHDHAFCAGKGFPLIIEVDECDLDAVPPFAVRYEDGE